MSQDMNVYQRSTSSIGHLLRSSSPTSGGLTLGIDAVQLPRGDAVHTRSCKLPTPRKKETAHVDIHFASRRNSHTGRQHFRGLGSAPHRGKGTRNHYPL